MARLGHEASAARLSETVARCVPAARVTTAQGRRSSRCPRCGQMGCTLCLRVVPLQLPFVGGTTASMLRQSVCPLSRTFIHCLVVWLFTYVGRCNVKLFPSVIISKRPLALRDGSERLQVCPYGQSWRGFGLSRGAGGRFGIRTDWNNSFTMVLRYTGRS